MPVQVGNFKKPHFKFMLHSAFHCDTCNGLVSAIYTKRSPSLDILICWTCRKVYELGAGEITEKES
jgi:transcription elongation factor Elf1